MDVNLHYRWKKCHLLSLNFVPLSYSRFRSSLSSILLVSRSSNPVTSADPLSRSWFLLNLDILLTFTRFSRTSLSPPILVIVLPLDPLYYSWSCSLFLLILSFTRDHARPWPPAWRFWTTCWRTAGRRWRRWRWCPLGVSLELTPLCPPQPRSV